MASGAHNLRDRPTLGRRDMGSFEDLISRRSVA
jgi:hypothetical protein